MTMTITMTITMAKIRYTHTSWLLCLAALLLGSCTNEDYKLYDTRQKDSVFFEYKNDDGEACDSVHYDFNYDTAREHVIRIPVTLMGMPADHDRKVCIASIDSLSDMRYGVHYTISGDTLKAGRIGCTLEVHLLRDNDPELLHRNFSVCLEIQENSDLRAVGAHLFRITYSDIHPLQRPEWWYTSESMPVYTYQNAQLFFQYFYERAPKADIGVYNEIISAYGDFFVKAVELRGPLAMYTNFIKRWVLIPLYEDTKDEIEWQGIPSL